jgi:hypothetical protein
MRIIPVVNSPTTERDLDHLNLTEHRRDETLPALLGASA